MHPIELESNTACCSKLCCEVLCCAVLRCAVLCCAVLYCAVLCCADTPMMEGAFRLSFIAAMKHWPVAMSAATEGFAWQT